MYGQFVQVIQNRWIGRKNVSKNWLPKEELEKRIKDAIEDKKVNVHVSLFLRDQIENYNYLVGNFVMDFDGRSNREEDLETIRIEMYPLIMFLQSIEAPFYITFTGNRGFRIIIPQKAFNLEASKDLPTIYKVIAENLKERFNLAHLDLQIYSPSHLIRVTNTINEKSNLFEIPLTLAEFNTLTIQQIKEIASDQKFLKELKENKVNTTLAKIAEEVQKKMKENSVNKEHKEVNTSFLENTIPECIKNLLETSISEGKRNMHLVRAASILYASIPKENAKDLIMMWNENNNPPLPKGEVENVLNYLEKKQYQFSCKDPILQQYCPFGERKILCPLFRKRLVEKI